MWRLLKNPFRSKVKRSRSQLELQLLERTAALEELTKQLLRVQDDERRRVARDLHDSTGQTLTALKMAIYVLQRKFETTEYVKQQLS